MRASLIVALYLVSGCGGGDDGTGTPATWQKLGDQRPSSLLSVWSSGLDDIWVVGGREGIGGGAPVFHYDGTAWSRLDPGVANVDLWSVFGFANDAVFIGGSNGTILRVQAGAFEKLATPTTDIVFGMWGSSPSDVYAVGGQNTGSAFVWHLEGSQFVAVPGSVPIDLTTGAVWKVTGRSASDVWMSASQGLVVHWDGQTFSNEMVGGSEDALFSIGCDTAGCVAVGSNVTNGVLYQDDGGGWASRVPTTDGPVWRGVTPVGDNMYVVGQFGAVMHLIDNSWVPDQHGLTGETLHAAWANADGTLFAVGGRFDQVPTTAGVLLYKGIEELPPLP